ncbi:MAG: choice-of-anchor Q domain-containing protein [Chthoniobacterales bacterium]
MKTQILRSALGAVAILSFALCKASGTTYVVNTSSDSVVVNACANQAANCSLRGAILTANAHSGDTIVFNIQEFCPNTGCVINLLSALPDITAPMTIMGPTPFTIQRGSSATTNFRIFNVTTSGTVNFTSLTIAKGLLTGFGNNGAGIQNASSGTVNITNCTVRDNQTESMGGGIFNNTGTVTISGTTLSQNNAHLGGGIFNNNGSLIVSQATFSANEAEGPNNASSNGAAGGAIYGDTGPVTITNTTFSGNFALGGASSTIGGDANGGAIFTESTTTLNISNCTIANNGTFAGGGTTNGKAVGGGIYATGPATVKSTIIALNTANLNPVFDVKGSFTSAGFNLIGKVDGSTGFTAATDQTGTIAAPLDPKLDPNKLQSNGGPTQTIALLLGSPAVDKGTSAGLSGNLTIDQRGSGFPRIFEDSAIGNAAGGDGTDIGAFELQNGQPTKFANVSSRLPLQTGDSVLFAGFIITGTQSKKVMLRAIGPSLNLPGQLENPTLELFQGNTSLGSNDDWQNQPAADRQAVIDTTIPPPNDLEAALVRTLPANSTAFTAVVRGANNGTGIGLIEVYDLDRLIDSKLANISTRGFVQTGDNVLIGGTIVLGNAAQKVIVRALGPSLMLPGKMGDPTLELRDGNGGLIEANDNWKDSPNKQAIIDSTIPPTNDLESAIVQVLPGNGAIYTAVLRGVNDTTGIAVVEVYALD